MQSQLELIRSADITPTPWKNGGGSTRTLAQWPADSGLENFAWRISVARIEHDGPFSGFAGVDRTLILLDGNGMLLNFKDRPVQARKFHEPATAAADHRPVARSAPVCQLNVEQTTHSLPNGPRTAPRRALDGLATHVHETFGLVDPTTPRIDFAGEDSPDCRLLDGPTTDFNLMWARKSGTASLTVQQFEGELHRDAPPNRTLAAYLCSGHATTAAGEMQPGDMLIGTSLRLKGQGELWWIDLPQPN